MERNEVTIGEDSIESKYVNEALEKSKRVKEVYRSLELNIKSAEYSTADLRCKYSLEEKGLLFYSQLIANQYNNNFSSPKLL